MEIVGKINNNVAVGIDNNGKSIIVFGSGIGFKKIPYHLNDLSKIEKTYYDIDSEYVNLMKSLPEEILILSSKIVDIAAQKIEVLLNPNLVITLADHLSFSIKRFQSGMNFNNPLSTEVARLYPTELNVGELGLTLIEESTSLKLPFSEAVSIALHIVNAEAAESDMGKTMRDTKILSGVMKIIEEDFSLKFHDKEYIFNRFKAHLLLLLKNFDKDKERNKFPGNVSMLNVFRSDFPAVYKSAQHISTLFWKELEWKLNDDELLYLMIHINRIANS